MSNLYGEIKDELKWVADKLEELEFTYKVYNRGVQYNAEDDNGVIHSFYPTTGTILLHRSNDRKDHATKTIRDSDIDTFIFYLSHPDEVQKLFK